MSRWGPNLEFHRFVERLETWLILLLRKEAYQLLSIWVGFHLRIKRNIYVATKDDGEKERKERGFHGRIDAVCAAYPRSPQIMNLLTLDRAMPGICVGPRDAIC